MGNIRECLGMLENVGESWGMFKNDNVEMIFAKKRIDMEDRRVGM